MCSTLLGVCIFFYLLCFLVVFALFLILFKTSIFLFFSFCFFCFFACVLLFFCPLNRPPGRRCLVPTPVLTFDIRDRVLLLSPFKASETSGSPVPSPAVSCPFSLSAFFAPFIPDESLLRFFLLSFTPFSVLFSLPIAVACAPLSKQSRAIVQSRDRLFILTPPLFQDLSSSCALRS